MAELTPIATRNLRTCGTAALRALEAPKARVREALSR